MTPTKCAEETKHDDRYPHADVEWRMDPNCLSPREYTEKTPSAVVDQIERDVDQEQADQHPDGTECHMPPVDESGKAEGNACKGYANHRQSCICRWFPQKPYERWSLVLATLTLGAVVWYACIANQQWQAMETANRQNYEALTTVQRAFVFVKTLEAARTKNCPPGTSALEFSVVWENSGTTPAKSVFAHVNSDWRSTPLPDDFDYADKAGGPDPMKTPFLIGAKATSTAEPLQVPMEVIADVQQGALHVYFWGWARYRDVFEGTPARVTKICYELIHVLGDLTDPTASIQSAATPCPHHNCADEDCEKEPTRSPP